MEKFTEARINNDARKPEIVTLREQLAEIKRQRKAAASEAAATRRQLERSLNAYANQVQVLALRNAELAAENRRLHQSLEDQQNVSWLHRPPAAAPDASKGAPG